MFRLTFSNISVSMHGLQACACMFSHVYGHMYRHICAGLGSMSGIILYCSSTPLTETDSLSETQSLLLQLFLLASLLGVSPVSVFQGWNYIYMGSGGLHTCVASTLTGAIPSTLNDCFIASH